MNQKGMATIFVVISLFTTIVLGIVGFFLGQRLGFIPISWEEAKKLLNDCEVTMVFQTHSKQVSLTLKDGSSRSTSEPSIDDILYLADKAEKTCGFEILKATE